MVGRAIPFFRLAVPSNQNINGDFSQGKPEDETLAYPRRKI